MVAQLNSLVAEETLRTVALSLSRALNLGVWTPPCAGEIGYCIHCGRFVSAL